MYRWLKKFNLPTDVPLHVVFFRDNWIYAAKIDLENDRELNLPTDIRDGDVDLRNLMGMNVYTLGEYYVKTVKVSKVETLHGLDASDICDIGDTKTSPDIGKKNN
jgi:hypothetical protein